MQFYTYKLEMIFGINFEKTAIKCNVLISIYTVENGLT